MKKPELENVWQTRIKIGAIKSIGNEGLSIIAPEMIREKVSIFSKLLDEHKIDRYCFLIHTFPEDKENYYFHIKFSKINGNDLTLPEYCSKPKKEKLGPTITGVDESLITNQDIRKVWKLIGEQSELIIRFVQTHKDKFPNQQFVQFMHFNLNMMGLGHRSRFYLQKDNVLMFIRF